MSRIQNNEVDLSIIIPIYNVKDYLEKAIDSALSQKLSKFEVILVNDGSTDGCFEICERYRDIDNIKIIHKKNGGLVSARKIGVGQAEGTFITFLDGDDWVEDEYYSNMVNILRKEAADIVCSGYIKDYADSGKCEKKANRVESGRYTGEQLQNVKKRSLYGGKYYEYGIIPTVWSKVFEKEIIERWLKDIPDNITVGEDVACTMPIIMDSMCLVVDNENTGYHYRCTGASMSRSFPENRIYEVLSMLLYFKSAMLKFENNKSQLDSYYLYSSFLIKHVIKGTSISDDNDQIIRFRENEIVEDILKNVLRKKQIPLKYRMMYLFLYRRNYQFLKKYYNLMSKLNVNAKKYRKQYEYCKNNEQEEK